MQVGIAGHGKMGKAVERIAEERGHGISVLPLPLSDNGILSGIDCVIDFTHADVAPEIVRTCIDTGVPVVSGTTGWNAGIAEAYDYCREKGGAMLWAPNFSVGMHILFSLNEMLADVMEHRSEYEVSIYEAHHTEKKDAPSGTAIALASQIIDILSRKADWKLTGSGQQSDADLMIEAERIPDVKGIHEVQYRGPHDILSIRHEALSRDGFALGAVLAAEWLAGKAGVFRFSDVLSDLLGQKKPAPRG